MEFDLVDLDIGQTTTIRLKCLEAAASLPGRTEAADILEQAKMFERWVTENGPKLGLATTEEMLLELRERLAHDKQRLNQWRAINDVLIALDPEELQYKTINRSP